MGGGMCCQNFDCRLTTGEICASPYLAIGVHYTADAKRIIFDISLHFFFHTPCPLSLRERGGSTPHPAFHVRERRDHPSRGEWYRADRTLWQILEKLCADELPCYKESACGGRSSRHSVVTRVACSPSPAPPRRGGACEGRLRTL